jgi:hypothetical protein
MKNTINMIISLDKIMFDLKIFHNRLKNDLDINS